jgi:hypothetical protein
VHFAHIIYLWVSYKHRCLSKQYLPVGPRNGDAVWYVLGMNSIFKHYVEKFRKAKPYSDPFTAYSFQLFDDTVT